MAVFLALAGCRQADTPATCKRSRAVMGTFAEVTAVSLGKEVSRQAVEAAYGQLNEINDLMSDYVADSEVGRINALKAGQSMVVSDHTLYVLQQAAKLSEATGGAFDVTCRPMVQLWKKAGSDNKMPTDQELQTAVAKTGSSKLAIDPDARTVTPTVDGVQIDLGGIAKGYALDLAVERIKAEGATGGLVDVGGDVLAFGSRSSDGSPWVIGIKHPFRTGLFGKVAINDRAIATSGLQQRFFEIDGRRYSHIIDPRTGRPVQEAPSVTVIAQSGLLADVWATVLSVLTVEDGMRLAEKRMGVEALWIWGSAEHPETAMTEGFKSCLVE